MLYTIAVAKSILHVTYQQIDVQRVISFIAYGELIYILKVKSAICLIEMQRKLTVVSLYVPHTVCCTPCGTKMIVCNIGNSPYLAQNTP